MTGMDAYETVKTDPLIPRISPTLGRGWHEGDLYAHTLHSDAS